LHGELKKVRSTKNPELIYTLDGWELKIGDLCQMGSQLRPHIVWFGEDVPLIQTAAEIVALADIFIVIGTSLNVYPAAGLVNFAKSGIPKFIVDPHANKLPGIANLNVIADKAGNAIPKLVDDLLAGKF
jgi:NAD-dependent deacetylase